jgi:hypothetical protein
MRPSSSRRSTIPSAPEHRGPARRGVDVYLMPAIIGGGRGDVEDVLVVGRTLARTGHDVRVPRSGPRRVLDDRSFDWTGIRRVRAIVPTRPRAVTISSQFGVTAADARDEPLGRAGPWTQVRTEIDRAYGPGQVLHVSLEEFARARPAVELAEERWRESGRTARDRRRRRGSRGFRREVADFVRLYRKFRALDRPDVLPLFPTFRRSARFASEFPESVQVGPIWPEPAVRPPIRDRAGTRRVLWYASPSTSERLAPRLMEGLSAGPGPVRLRVRAPRPLDLRSNPRVKVEFLEKDAPSAWRTAWATTDLAIVTGSRTLLEAIDEGVPFLYFNGVMGRGSSARCHRPEKLRSLLEILRSAGVASSVRRDLADFARLRRIEDILDRWAYGSAPLSSPLRRRIERGFPDPFQEGGRLVGAVVDRFASGGSSANDLVVALRQESRAPARRARPASSKV